MDVPKFTLTKILRWGIEEYSMVEVIEKPKLPTSAQGLKGLELANKQIEHLRDYICPPVGLALTSIRSFY